MNSLLNRILLKNNKPVQLATALLGLIAGLLVVMAGVFVFISTKNLLSEKELLAGDYLVLGKKAGLLNTISGTAPTFSQTEVEELKAIPGVDEAGSFIAGSFRASMQLSGAAADYAGPGFKTDMFFESVPDRFVDAGSDIWHWKQGDPVVPLIIPADFIQLYNSAFAQSQGLPVIPESLLKTVEFDVTINGNGRSVDYRARIAGFSKRINTVLVPETFMRYANNEFGSKTPKKASRVILHTKDPASPALAKALKSKGYELNEEKLRSSELNNVLQMMIKAVSAVGLLIVLLSLLGFVQYNQLLAYRSAWEIQTLHYLGYSIGQIAKPYIRFVSMSLLITFLLSAVSMLAIRQYISLALENRGISIELSGVMWPLACGFVISLLIACISGVSAFRQIRKLAV